VTLFSLVEMYQRTLKKEAVPIYVHNVGIYIYIYIAPVEPLKAFLVSAAEHKLQLRDWARGWTIRDSNTSRGGRPDRLRGPSNLPLKVQPNAPRTDQVGTTDLENR